MTRRSPSDVAAQKAVELVVDYIWLAFATGLIIGLFLGWLT